MGTVKQLSYVVAGPAVAGLCMGLRSGLQVSLSHAVSLPVICVGVAVLMIPALYIGAALAGIAPSAGEVIGSARESLASASTVYLGLAPSLAFLVVTADETTTVLLLSVLALALGVLLGLRNLYAGIFAGSGASPGRAFPLFAAWSLVSMGIGGRLLLGSLTG